MRTPYIGITDFTTSEEVGAMRRVFNKHKRKGQNRVLHVGVMMSYKTLHGMPTKWQNAFPAKEDIEAIFLDSNTYNCLHYADYDTDYELWRSLVQAITHGGLHMNALQLDMIWPDPEQVAHGVHTSRRNIEVILQIGRNSLEVADNDPSRVVGMLEDYESVIHRVLLDRSMGQGLSMDAEYLLPFVRAIHERFPDLGIGVAGGLGPDTMHLVEPLLEAFPDLSIDAQGKLRPSGSAMDPVDWEMAAEYLVKALKICS